jgi:hypothetical protein
MISRETRERYLADTLDIRLGGLAADLVRIVSFAKNIKAIKSVNDLLNESAYFIELSAPDLLPDRLDEAARLVDIQRGLVFWQRRWQEILDDMNEREKLSAQARVWSDEVLKMSGLLDQE